MKTSRRLAIPLVLVALLLALPATALATQSLWVAARLNAAQEVPPVVGSSALGVASVNGGASGFNFRVRVDGLSSDATGIHLHGPALPGSNAPVLLSLCGSPGPSAIGACPTGSSFTIQGPLAQSLFIAWGVTPGQFVTMLNNGQVYVNVHSTNFPSGEIRGQFARYD